MVGLCRVFSRSQPNPRGDSVSTGFFYVLRYGYVMNREEQVLEMVRDGLVKFSVELQGYSVLLFGSRARGDARERSDFDIGIVGDAPVDLQTFYKLADCFEQLPTLYRIDWVDLNRAENALRKRALGESKLIYG
ncbi:MAG: Nucleotidyltransferase domain protein [Verrucomicrobia bacterium ADurb.Bin474]|nr:MAG: Nucleotidyltransferase domain protein [Verrucomicrobia bacterium ADurb.Bin474]